MPEYRLIPLHGKYGEGKFAKVSPEDFDFALAQHFVINAQGYAANYNSSQTKNESSFLLHRQILGRMQLEAPTPAHVADHKDRDRLNNTRENLRWVTRAENRCNSDHKRVSASGYVGVIPTGDYGNGQTYVARIKIGGKNRVVGTFFDPAQAAKARDALVRFYYGDFGVTNVPGTEAMNLEQAKEFALSLRRTSSKFSGVTWHKDRKKWAVQVKVNGKQKYFGLYENEIDAAKKVDEVLVGTGASPINFSK